MVTPWGRLVAASNKRQPGSKRSPWFTMVHQGQPSLLYFHRNSFIWCVCDLLFLGPNDFDPSWLEWTRQFGSLNPWHPWLLAQESKCALSPLASPAHSDRTFSVRKARGTPFATPHQSGSVAALTLSPRLSPLPLEDLLLEPKGSGCWPSWSVTRWQQWQCACRLPVWAKFYMMGAYDYPHSCDHDEVVKELLNGWPLSNSLLTKWGWQSDIPWARSEMIWDKRGLSSREWTSKPHSSHIAREGEFSGRRHGTTDMA